jgi:hypothetical protein
MKLLTTPEEKSFLTSARDFRKEHPGVAAVVALVLVLE